MAPFLWALVFVSSAFATEDRSFRDVSRHGRKQVPLPTGHCVKDTSAPCRHWNQGNAVDYLTQCLGENRALFLDPTPASLTNVSTKQASCSADTLNVPTGTCICGEGFCADTDLLCHRGSYQIINEVFSITTKAFPAEKLYMTPDGKVLIGTPPDPRAAQWRISVTGQGVKILWTELYANSILQEYENCATLTDSFGLSYSKCEKFVGHVQDPRAGEMGWYVELHEGAKSLSLGMEQEQFLQLRSVSSWDLFFITWATKEGKACETRAQNCAGDAGAFKFDPPLLARMDFQIDSAPGSLPPGLAAYRVTVGLVLTLFLCITCVFGTSSKGLASFTTCLMIPMNNLARAIGLGQGATITRTGAA